MLSALGSTRLILLLSTNDVTVRPLLCCYPMLHFTQHYSISIVQRLRAWRASKRFIQFQRGTELFLGDCDRWCNPEDNAMVASSPRTPKSPNRLPRALPTSGEPCFVRLSVTSSVPAIRPRPLTSPMQPYRDCNLRRPAWRNSPSLRDRSTRPSRTTISSTFSPTAPGKGSLMCVV